MVGELLPAPYHSCAAPNGLNVPDSSRCSDGTSLMTEGIEVPEFLERFRDPAESARRELLLQAIQIASQAKMIQSEEENQYLAKLIAL